MIELVRMLDKAIYWLAWEVIIVAIIFNAIWFVIWLQALKKWLQIGYHYRWWYTLIDFSSIIYSIFIIILELIDINVNIMIYANTLALLIGLQIAFGLPARLESYFRKR